MWVFLAKTTRHHRLVELLGGRSSFIRFADRSTLDPALSVVTGMDEAGGIVARLMRYNLSHL